MKPHGYWWQCVSDSRHIVTPFARATSLPIVRFFFALSKAGWDQSRLRQTCPECGEPTLRIAYDFPRQKDPLRIVVEHVVGISDGAPFYLPMMWEGHVIGESDPCYDFKYVGWRKDLGDISLGLRRPAVFSGPELKCLFDDYTRLVGRDPLGRVTNAAAH
jgi:hypothetical protein